MEAVYKIFDYYIGAYIQISEGSDGLGLLELKSFDENNKEFGTLDTITIEQAKLLSSL